MSCPEAHNIDACAKCKRCGHSRWQHVDLEDRDHKSKLKFVPPRECRKDGCGCQGFEEGKRGREDG